MFTYHYKALKFIKLNEVVFRVDESTRSEATEETKETGSNALRTYEQLSRTAYEWPRYVGRIKQDKRGDRRLRVRYTLTMGGSAGQ